MTTSVNKGKARQVSGQIQAWRGKVTGNRVAQVAGKFDQLIGSLQQTYGYRRERAISELKRRLGKHTPAR